MRVRSLGFGQIDAVIVLGGIVVDDGIAFVVIASANEPAEDMLGSFGIGDARSRIEPIDGEDVVPGDRAPMRLARIEARPALDPGEQAFDARPVAS